MIELYSDEFFMKQALIEANRALEKDEVPIGAVIALKNKIIARAHNLVETLNDVTAHAEMQAFTAAANTLGGKYLDECTIYVTLEPCIMCAGASYWAQISKIVYGARDLKRGFLSLRKGNIIHPKTKVIGNVMEIECSTILKSFFEVKR